MSKEFMRWMGSKSSGSHGDGCFGGAKDTFDKIYSPPKVTKTAGKSTKSTKKSK